MKKFNIVIIILLIISLLMNYINKNEIKKLRNDTRSNFQMLQMLQGDIHSINSAVRNTLEDFKKK